MKERLLRADPGVCPPSPLSVSPTATAEGGAWSPSERSDSDTPTTPAPLTGVEVGVAISSKPSAAVMGNGREDLAGVDCLTEGVATHMMEVLKETSADEEELISMTSVALVGLTEVRLATPRGTLTWFLGVGTALDCFGGVASLLRAS